MKILFSHSYSTCYSLNLPSWYGHIRLSWVGAALFLGREDSPWREWQFMQSLVALFPIFESGKSFTCRIEIFICQWMMKPIRPCVPVWRGNIFTFHCSHLRKCYLWAMPLLGGVSEGTQLEVLMGIIRDSQENSLHCLAYLPERLLIAHPTWGFAQSFSFYLLPHVVKRHCASMTTGRGKRRPLPLLLLKTL